MHHPMQAHMGAYPAHNVTTELIQKYLDENKQLILAILDNQNLGKLNECAAYQAKLQANLMYLAAIADSQPQPPPGVHAAQVPQAAAMQAGMQYMANQQAQQQMAQQSFMAARNPLQYSQQPYPSLNHAQQHQQQAMHAHAHQGMNAGGTNSINGLAPESGMGNNTSLPSGGFPDFGRSGGNTGDVQANRVFSGGPESDIVSATEAGHGTSGGLSGAGHAAEESETSYLRGSEEEGN